MVKKSTITCPNCGEKISYQCPVGRKKKNIDFNFICKALQACSRPDGRVNFSQSAAFINKRVDETIAAGFILMRLQREADDREMTMDDLLGEYGLRRFSGPVHTNEKKGASKLAKQHDLVVMRDDLNK